jgi:hypothetical protein
MVALMTGSTANDGEERAGAPTPPGERLGRVLSIEELMEGIPGAVS